MMKHNFEDIKGHIIICGYGRVGRQAASDLLNSYARFVILERDTNVVNQIKENQQLNYLEGDATKDEVLEKANIKEARALLSTFPNDADNLFVIVSARAMNPDLYIISRISEEINAGKIINAGANEVIMPDKVGGGHMAQLVTRPDIIEFLDTLLLQSAEEVNLEEVHCSALPKNRQMNIRELEIRKHSGVNVVGVKQKNGKLIHNPDPAMTVSPGDTLIILGKPHQVKTMRELLTKKYEQNTSDR